MKIPFLLLSLFMICFMPEVSAQNNNITSGSSIDAVTCAANTFYGLTSTNEIVSLTINGSSVTNNGVISTSMNNINSLAVGNDLINGTSQHIFYSSNVDSITYNDGTIWNPVLFDPVTYHNAGGAGSFVYYMSNAFPSTISRFTGTALNTILIDSNLTFTVADIGVSNYGTIYYFSGTGASTQFMYEISSTGNLLNTYPLSLFSAAAYGCFVMNNTIYVGIGPSGSPANSIIPITISGMNATVGSPISMPAINFKDLASCIGEVTDVTSVNNSENIVVYPNPSSNIFHCEIPGTGLVEFNISDVSGRIFISKNFNSGKNEIDLSHLANGVYFAKFIFKDEIIIKTIQKF